MHPKLVPDSGVIYIDQNGARNPSSPLEPLFRALFSQNPDFDIRDIDLVTDRNNVRKLLRFVQGSSNDSFQIGVEIIGKTTLFTRIEPKTTDTIQGFRGFGHSFEHAYTKKQIGSTGHHRMVTYHFSDMKCIVRHETDGYIGNGAESITTRAVEPTDSLSDILGALSISKSDKIISNLPGTIVKTDGKVVDLSSTLEIKTRAASRTLDMSEVLPQLWISQTPNLVVGYHRNGVFSGIRLRNVKQEVRNWELSNQGALCRLACLMRRITTVMKQSGGSSAVVQCDAGAKLRIVSGDQKRALPDDLYSRWEEKKNPDDNLALAQTRTTAQGHSEDTQATRAEPSQTDPTNLKSKDNGQDATPSRVRDGTPFADVINYSLHKGLRQFFRRMPTQLFDYHILCESLKSHAIDILEGRQLRGIMADMRRGKGDWDPEERREIEGLKSLARDSAFRLLYVLVMRELESAAGDRNMAYNATLFVVSHPRIFKSRTRRMVREAFDEAVHVLDKQRNALNKWSVKDSASGESQENDATTEEEDFGYDSDWSY